MTDRAALLQLRDRLNAATGPDESLDNAIFAGLRGLVWIDEPRGIRSGTLRWDDGSPTRVLSVPKYTASIDAAVTLVPEGFGYMMRCYGRDAASALINYPPRMAIKHDASVGSTPALALCLARVEYELAKTEATT